jgi:hypothetical protein
VDLLPMDAIWDTNMSRLMRIIGRKKNLLFHPK